MRRAFSDQGASRITRKAVFIYNLVSVFGAAVAPPLHPSAEKIRGSLPLFAPANIGPSHVSTNFLLHHLFRGLFISITISATNASYLQLRGCAVKEGLLILSLSLSNTFRNGGSSQSNLGDAGRCAPVLANQVLQMVDTQAACGGLVRDPEEREVLRGVGGGSFSIGRALGK